VSFYQNVPLELEVELFGFSRVNLCHPANFEAVQQNMTHTETINDIYKHDLVEGSAFDVISTEQEIEEIENYNQTDDDSSDLQEISSGDYKKLEQFFGNITRFLKSLTDATNQIVENQTKSEK
jgi:hypothetical protein